MLSFLLAACLSPDLAGRIEELTLHLRQAPQDARLYFRRGELYRRRGDWAAAEADLLRATELSPTLLGAGLALARVWLGKGEPFRAKLALDRFVDLAPDHALGRLARGRAWWDLGFPDEAARDYARGLALLRR